MEDPKNPEIEDIVTGLELSLMTQEQVVGVFRDLVNGNLAAAVGYYEEFATRLDEATSNGDRFVRMLVGGPDSSFRAELVDIVTESYATASNDVKHKTLELVLRPLVRDNSFYIQLAVARMKNPYVIADIARSDILLAPSPAMYEEDLLKNDNLKNILSIQVWLDKFGKNYFAATTLALQRDSSTEVEVIIEEQRELFEGAAHIVAAYHDMFAENKIAKDSLLSKDELTTKYRSRFVDAFAEMVFESSQRANWLPLTSF